MKYLFLALPFLLAYCMASVQVEFHYPLIRERLMTLRTKALWALGRVAAMLLLFGGIAVLWHLWWPMMLLLIACALFFQVWFNRSIASMMGENVNYIGNTGFFDILILALFMRKSRKWVKENHQHEYRNDIYYAWVVHRVAGVLYNIEASVGAACVAAAAVLL